MFLDYSRCIFCIGKLYFVTCIVLQRKGGRGCLSGRIISHPTVIATAGIEITRIFFGKQGLELLYLFILVSPTACIFGHVHLYGECIGYGISQAIHNGDGRVTPGFLEVILVIILFALIVSVVIHSIKPFVQTDRCTVLLHVATGIYIVHNDSFGSFYYFFPAGYIYGSVQYFTEDIEIDILELREHLPISLFVTAVVCNTPLFITLTPYQLWTVDYGLSGQRYMFQSRDGSGSHRKIGIAI